MPASSLTRTPPYRPIPARNCTPERLRALCASMVCRALEDLRVWERNRTRDTTTAGARNAIREARRHAMKALRWLRGEDGAVGLSFADACEVLGIDTTIAARKILRQVNATALAELDRFSLTTACAVSQK